MNKVYKSIWNAVTRSWTAVSEAQRIKGKKSRSLSFGVAFVCPLFLFGPLSYAADVDKNYTDPIVIGLDQSVTVSDKLIIDGNDKNLKIDFDYNRQRRFDVEKGLSLISQTGGFSQKFLTLTDFSCFTEFSGANVSIDDSLGRDFVQNIYQNNSNVAQGIYILGEGAYKLQNLNKDILGTPTVESTGVSVALSAGQANVEVLSTLVGLSLQSQEELSLEVDGQQSFYAKLLGKGSVKYSGSNKTQDQLTIVDLNYGDIFQGSTTFFPNTDYVGSTTFENVTAYVESISGLGSTSSLLLINSDLRKDNTIRVQGDIRVDKNSTIDSFSLDQENPLQISAQNIFVENADSLTDNCV